MAFLVRPPGAAAPSRNYPNLSEQSSGLGGGFGYSGGYGSTLPTQMVTHQQSSGLWAGLQQRKPFFSGQRRRLNVYPLLLTLLIPWGLFCGIFWASSFVVHYRYPFIYNIVIAVAAIAVAIVCITTVVRRFKFYKSSERAPSWLTFFSLSLILALVLGYFMGNRNYNKYMKPYYDFQNLNTYTDVDPDRMRGQQLMDAAAVEFSEGSHLDIEMSSGFKHGTLYCVAPIVLGNETRSTYDFWAVGTECCSGNAPDFHCAGSTRAHSNGLRLLGGGREYYRLAVQQAEAAYGIRAVHPLFFQWVVRPVETVQGWQTTARSTFNLWVYGHLLLQAFLVICAAFAFSKLGMEGTV